jgi:hypothetical protein
MACWGWRNRNSNEKVEVSDWEGQPRPIQSCLRHYAKFGALSFQLGVQCPTKRQPKRGVPTGTFTESFWRPFGGGVGSVNESPSWMGLLASLSLKTHSSHKTAGQDKLHVGIACSSRSQNCFCSECSASSLDLRRDGDRATPTRSLVVCGTDTHSWGTPTPPMTPSCAPSTFPRLCCV